MTVKTPKNNIRYIFTKYIRTIVIFFAISVAGSIYVSAQMLHASITVSDTTEQNLTPISPLMYGGFIEYLEDCVYGSHGFAAQELLNRGFDIHDYDGNGVSEQWNMWKSSESVQGKYSLQDGGYNKHGVYYQQINLTSSGKIGIAQDIYLTNGVGSDCYVYCKSEKYTGSVYAALMSLDGLTIYSSFSLGKCSEQWQKKTVKFPTLSGTFQAKLVFYIDTLGTVDFDEASFLPENHFFGIRQEQLDLYKSWKPSPLRFFGGCFSDLKAAVWEKTIGDIDQRTSPNFDWHGVNQRIEIGTDEYMLFCQEIGVEPQLTANFGNGTPEDAAAWVEYCNGDSLSKFGSLRAKNGHPKPYKVKYWEIGNEQYGSWEEGHTTAPKYAERYLEFYHAMKKVDSSIKIMINGDLWGFEWNDTIIRIAGENADYISLHNAMGNEITKEFSKDSVFTILMFNPYFFNNWLTSIEDALKKSGFKSSSKMAITEMIQFYGNLSKSHDENNASLQSGLWNACTFNVMLNHTNSIGLVNKTIFQGVIQSGVNTVTGERIIYGDPSYHVLNLVRNRFRKKVISTTVESPMYDYSIWKNNNWLNSAVTYSEDTLVFSLVNTHPTDSMTVLLRLPFSIYDTEVFITQLYSNDYTDTNVPDYPNRIVPVSWKQTFSGTITLPPHSFTVVTLPTKTKPAIDSTPDISQLDYEIQPNPAEGQITIAVENPGFNKIGFEIFNSTGEKIYSMPPVYYTKGHISIPVQTSLLPIGSYYCKAILHSEVITKKFIIAR